MTNGEGRPTYENIRTQQTGRVLCITLNRPEQRNPLSEAMCHDLIDALGRADRADDVWAIVLTGAGESFCAGGDLREFQRKRSEPSLDVYEEGFATADVFKLFARLTTPVIAAVNGAALGGGFGLACACHLAVGAETARLGCPEVRLGLFPLVIQPAIRSALGDRRALELSLTGRILSAQEALNMGVLVQVAPPAEVLAEAMAIAEGIAARSRVAYRLGLSGFNLTRDMTADIAIEHLNTLRVVAFQTEDVAEGAAAFLEKRPPHFSGR